MGYTLSLIVSANNTYESSLKLPVNKVGQEKSNRAGSHCANKNPTGPCMSLQSPGCFNYLSLLPQGLSLDV